MTMRLKTLGCLLLLSSIATVSLGCTSEVVIRSPPPADRAEELGAAPSGEHLWIRGYWEWSGNEYTWVRGHWEARRPLEVWSPGHWRQTAGGWVWVPGRWYAR
jgi:hypothetical protein